MSAIVPRWEWRTFGPGVEIADPHFAALESTGRPGERRDLPAVRAPARRRKIRDGLMDIKALRRGGQRTASSSGRPVMKVAFPIDGGGRRARRSRRCGLPGAGARPRDVHVRRSSSRSSPGPARPARRRGPQAPRPLRDQRLHVGGHRRHRGRRSPPGRSRSSREDAAAVIDAVAVGRPRRLRQHRLPARGWRALLAGAPPRYAVIDVRHELGQVPRRASGSPTAPGARSSTAPRSPAWARGWRRAARSADAAASARPRRSPAWSRRPRAHGALAIVGGRHRRAADREQRDGRRRRHRAAAGVRVRGHPRRGGGRLAYLAVKAGLGPRRRARWPCSTRAAAAPSSPSATATASTSGSASTSGAVRYTERFGLAGVVSPEVAGGGPGGHRRGPVAARRPRPGGRARRHGRRDHQHHRRSATASRPTTRTSSRARVLDRAEIDRQIELYRSQDAAEAARDRRACSPSARMSSSPGRASSARSWTSWAETR